MRPIVQWSLNFVAFGFFKAVIVTSVKCLGYSALLYMLLISCVISLLLPAIGALPGYIISWCSHRIPHLLVCFFHFSLQI